MVQMSNREIFINSISSSLALDSIRTLIKAGAINPDTVYLAMIDYDLTKLQEKDFYPLCLVSNVGQRILVKGIKVGDESEDSANTLKILRVLGFNPTEDDELVIHGKSYDIFGNPAKRIQKGFYKS